jgi:hypothetical protein
MDKGYTNTATLAGQKVPALNLAKDIRDKLIKGGVKESEIVIVDGKVSKERRAMIAEMMNRSEVRIVIGQTQTLGVGVNMQENLRAMHHLDAPWMPGELEQRNGRGQRQGNKWNTVMEYRYITERIDGRRWQLLVTKARFIHDFMRADMSLRVIDSDISDESQSTSADDVLNTLSDAAGDPRIMQIQQITAKKEKLERRKATFTAGITEQANLAGKLEKKTVPKLKATLKDVAADAAHVKALRESDAFSATIDGQTYDKRADAIEALDAFLEANPTPDTQRGPQPIPVEVQGFSVLREKGYWRGDEYMIRRAGDHTVGKPTIASMESNMRKLSTRQAELTEDIAQKEASIGRLRDAADQDFPQEEQLARTTARLDALEADLEANPIPSPGWLRYGAEVDTKIHVDGKERVVTGHRWDNDGFFVLTEDGDVPYKDVTDATGQRVYEDQDHTPPTAPDRDPDPKASPKNEPKKPQNFLASESGAARLPSGDFVQDLKAKGSDILNNAAKQPSDILTDLMAGRVIGSALSFVPGRKLFKDMAKRLPSAGTYQRAKEEMDALRNDWQGKTAEVSDAWLTLNGARGLLTVGGGITPKIRRERRKAQADNAKLMDLMHRATLAGVDPSLPLTANKAYDAHSKSNSRKSWSKAKAAQIETTWRLLRKELDDLGPEHSSLFRKVAAQYDEMGDDFEKAVIQNIKKANELAVVRAKRAHKAEMRRIKDEGLKGKDAADAKSEADAKLNRVVERGGWAVKSRINGLRKEFESNRLDGPYFPLARFGDYFVTVRDDDGKVTSFSRFEKRSQQRKFADEMKKTGQDVQTGVITDTGELKSQVDPNFLADVQGLLGDYDVPGELMDAVWQRWLETLPDHSIRTSQIHRKGRAGFAPDALRAFTSHMFHGAHQLARLKYGLDLEEAMDNARLEAAVDKDPERAGLVVNEMQKRHDFTMNPTGAAWTAAATSTAFVWYLGATPAAAMVNLTQTTVVGPAVMGAKFAKQGATGALKELGRATKDLSSNIASDVAQKAGSDGWPDTLTQDEREALEEAYRRGTIDKTQAHDVASVAETGIEYSPTRERVMRKVSWMFHNAEVANRSITFLAAYRMARNDGQRDVDAVETAANLTWDTHFDYQASSRPRFMQGDVARVVTTFRQFTVNMLYIMARGAHQSFKAETPELRREARYQLAGITMSMLAHAGIKGVWGYGIISFILGQFVGDDEDETAKAAFDTWLQDALLVEGETLGATSWNFIAGMALNGVPGHATGINLSERLGMPNLWFRDSNRIEDGEEWYTRMVTEALGPVFGIGAGFARGAKYASDGDYWRGVETAVPKVIRDAMKAGRYANEGVLTRRNEDPIMESVNFGHVFKQLMGFTSADIAERYESNSRMMNKQKQIVSRRSGIQRDIVSAILKGTKPTEETWARMREFNKQYPEYPITGDTIRRSAAGRVRSKQRNEFGVQLNPRLNRRLREAEPKGIYIN